MNIKPIRTHEDYQLALKRVSPLIEQDPQAGTDVAPMWVREFLSASGVLKQRLDERRGSHHKLISQQRIADWQAQGRLNADIDPTLLIISLCGLTLLPIASAKRVVQIDGPVLKQHVMSLLINGLGVK